MQAPGPSAWRFIRGARKHGLLAFVGQLWREYGDAFQVRVGGRTLFFMLHPDGVAHVNLERKDNYAKLESYEGVRKYILGEGLVASNGEHWRRQRRLIAPFFTPKAVRAYADIMFDDAHKLTQRWEQLAREGAEVSVDDEMAHVTASIILRALFSTEVSSQMVALKEAVEAMVAFSTDRKSGRVLPLPLWMPSAHNRRYKAARALTHSYIEGLIAERRAMDPAERPADLLSCLMAASDPDTGEAMGDDLLRDEAMTAFFAGYETTARTMTFAWYALASNPEAAAKLHAELDAVMGDGAPNLDTLRELPYTLNVVKEVLRLYPAAPFYARDAVADDSVCGFDVPAGTVMMISPYYTHRHPKFWPHAERFDPDRWSAANPQEHGHAYQPFATGPRICIGNNLSLLETHVLLALTARHFAPRLREGYVPDWQMRGVLTLDNGLPMTIAKRSPTPIRSVGVGAAEPANTR